MRDRQEPGAQGCIKKCGEEARDKGTQALFCRPAHLLGILFRLFAASLPH